MAIPQKRYIDITSGVAGQAAAGQRELIARLMSTNQLCGFGHVYEFADADAVLTHFGSASQEYIFASKYFGFVSKQISKPKKISFARWAKEALAPQITATKAAAAVDAFKALENPALTLTIGGTTLTVAYSGDTGYLDFSGDASLSDIASSVQNAIQGAAADAEAGALFADSTVTASLINGTTRFVFTGGETGAATIEAAEGTLAPLLGWDAASLPVLSDGSAAETPEAAMARVADISNNFATFDFLCDASGVDQLTADEKGAVAAWANAQNVVYCYLTGVTSLSASGVHAKTDGLEGCGLTLNAAPADYTQFIPMAVLAATDYTRPAAAQNLMYQQASGVTPTVETAALADYYDAMAINYYGATQSAGAKLAFYQRGSLQGSNIQDMGVFFNEIWLKDAFIVAFFNLLLAVPQLPAGRKGEDMVRGVMLEWIELAVTNGTILPLKDFTATQKAAIDNLTGVADSWQKVFANGWWLDINVRPVTSGGKTEYQLNYVLVYSKGDSVKKIVGNDIMI